MTHDEIISKIKKLLALSSSPNKNEAESAAIFAADMMRKYQIDKAQLVNTELEIVELPVYEAFRLDYWRIRLAVGMAPAFRCSILTSPPRRGYRKGKIIVAGFQDDTEAFHLVYVYMMDKVKRFGTNEGNDFKLGVAESLGHRIGETYNANEQEKALVISMSKVHDYMKKFQASERSPMIKDVNAFVQGQKEGNKFPLGNAFIRGRS